MEFEKLKTVLTEELTPVRAIPSLSKQVIKVLVVCTLTMATLVLILGSHNAISFTDQRFISEVFILIALTIISARAFCSLSIPGATSMTKEFILFALLYIAWILFLTTHEIVEGLDSGPLCSAIVTATALLLCPLFLSLAKKNAPLSKRSILFFGGLVPGAASALALQFICPAHSFNHLFLWHALPVLLVPIIGYMWALYFSHED